MRLLKLFALLATLATAAATAAQADVGAPWGPETPNFNLEVVLRPAAGGPDGGFGLVKFRQPNDAAKIIYLDTWVRDLLPGHRYALERAVDTNLDGVCTSTGWLSLGEIATDLGGTGRAALSRSVAMLPTGMKFDIHFRVVDAASPAVALESGCYEYAVSQ
jgi:hypothetical protein